ncbi:MAG: DUF5000 domain-containing lipoprotein [Bacteroidales bacterium]|nr:DUF5000 domain-containing lipoprotein [Bacteroidales bacterium]
MKKILYSLLLMFSPAIYFSCSELERIDQIDEDAAAPKALSVTEVKNTPGGAVIRVKIPDDKNLMGAVAEYERNGKKCIAKISKYVDSLVVEGFGNTEPRDIKVSSLGVNEKLSEPVIVTINPLLPPVQSVKFDIAETFGGVVVKIDNNVSNADLAIGLLVDTILTDIDLDASQIKWADVTTFHTSSEAINLSRRNLSPKQRIYGAFLRDRWDNFSDTIYKVLTPIEEIELKKNTYTNANLPTDWFVVAEGNESGYGLPKIWDGDLRGTFYASAHSSPMPSWFTISLGYTASISRIQKWPRNDYELYSSTAPRVFEVWGSTNPNPNGSFDESWHLLGTFEQFKPSGYGEGREVGTITEEDKTYWYYNTEFELVPTEEAPDPYQPVSYIRIKVLSNFATYGTEATMGQVIIGELTFWGQMHDDK